MTDALFVIECECPTPARTVRVTVFEPELAPGSVGYRCRTEWNDIFDKGKTLVGSTIEEALENAESFARTMLTANGCGPMQKLATA